MIPEMHEEIGTVISTALSPSPSVVNFVVTSGVIHRGQFVEIEFSQGLLVGLVVDVFKTNRYFERAESVKEFESAGRKLLEEFPVSEWEYLVAQTRLLGVFLPEEGLVKRASFPPSPGDKVKTAASATIEKFLGFEKDGLFLGEIGFHGTQVRLNLSRLLKKHLAVLAQSGAGKSNAVKAIIEEVLERPKASGRLSVVVFDVHGEYSSFGESGNGIATDFSGKTSVVFSSDIKIGVSKLNVGMIASIVSGLSAPQKRELEKVLNFLKSQMRSGAGPFGLDQVESAIFADKQMNESTSRVLLSWIASLKELRLFGKTDVPSIFDIVRLGHLTVFDLSNETDIKKKQIILSYFANRLFFERKNGKIPPFLFVVEEAHQMAPEKTREEAAISKRIIETIAREGRKFGACLCLVSQRPINLSTTALSQCSTHLILRVTNPYDLKHIGESSEGLDGKSIELINSLAVGEALLVGEAVNYPVFFKVRKSKSLPSRHEVSLEEAAKVFESKQEESLAEAKEFL